jgi:hypothetical protein
LKKYGVTDVGVHVIDPGRWWINPRELFRLVVMDICTETS